MAPIPLILCGQSLPHCKYIVANIDPKYEVIHVCHTTPTALSELPALLRGESITPSGGLGTNADSSSRGRSGLEVQGIIIGGGFPGPDTEQIRAAVNEVRPLPVFKGDPSKGAAAGGGPPAPDILIKRLHDCLTETWKEQRVDGGKGGWEEGFYLW